jgi:hypothetical protein
MNPKETIQAVLNDIRNPKTMRDLCLQDVMYVSLNYSNPDPHKISWSLSLQVPRDRVIC